MSHLGRWLSALVDGELEGEERDRVLNHVAGCTGCRQEANAMRALKRRLTSLADTSAEPAIAGRLIELAWTGQLGEDDCDLAEPAPSSAGRALRPGMRLLAASAGSALAAVGVMAFLLGSTGSPHAPKVTPSVDSYLLQHSYDAGQAPASSDPASAPASGHRHGAQVAGPALGRPGQFGPGPAAALAGSGAAASPGPSSSAAAIPAGAGRASSRSGTSHHPAGRSSARPMVSQPPG